MNTLRIALNDIRVVLKDRLILVWWFAMPLTFVFLLSFMIRDYTKQSTWLPVFLYDDHELAKILVQQLRGEGYYIDVKSRKDEHWINDWSRALVIPEDFSERILKGQRVDLTLTEGKGRPDRFMAAQALLIRVLIKLNTAIAAIDLVERGWSPVTREALLAELGKTPVLSVKNRQHFSLKPPPTGTAFTLPAYLVMFVMMMTVMYGGITLIYEHQEKRIHRLVAAPVSALEIFLGKMLGRMLQPILQGGILIVAGVALFRVSLGNHPLVLALVILSFAFFCGSLGLLFGVLFRTEQQVMGLGILATMVMAALGGCWWPLEVVPQTFKTIALFTPTYWAVQGIQDVMYFGKSWFDVLPECAVLCASGAILTAIAIPIFRWD